MKFIINSRVMILLIFSTLASHQIKAAQNCNRQNIWDRPFNKIAQINVHNATSTTKRGLVLNIKPCWNGWLPALCGYNTGINPVADQNWDLQDQLNNGLRVFKLPIHPVGIDNTPWVTHTLQKREINDLVVSIAQKLPFSSSTIQSAINSSLQKNLWNIDTSNTPFLNVLNQLKAFLDNNPHEIITLDLNTFDMNLMYAQFLNVFATSGIDAYLFKPNTGNLSWPTFGQMITSNQRLVVLCDTQMNQPGFIYSNQYTTANNYTYKSIDELNADDCSIINKDPNTLFIMNHFITGTLSGSTALANQANTYQALSNHIQKCCNSTGRYPNLIPIDYVDVHFDDIKRVIDEVNSKKW
ncbi:MAG: hypothetical protein P4L31_01645 [Candidatus Babeliales bacterium]|nr:hypothetical protein [Candidatus Babeliales bacterium]